MITADVVPMNGALTCLLTNGAGGRGNATVLLRTSGLLSFLLEPTGGTHSLLVVNSPGAGEGSGRRVAVGVVAPVQGATVADGELLSPAGCCAMARFELLPPPFPFSSSPLSTKR